MGQKANPIGLRLKITRSWESNWFAEKDKFGDYVVEDIKIRNHIYERVLRRKNYDKVEVSDIKIQRFPDAINIYIFTSRPGILIGKKGQDIENLRQELRKVIKTKANLNLNISEVKKADLDARVVAQSVGKMIEGRMNYKKAMKQAITRAMKSGAKGIKIQVSGRLGGSDIARREYFKDGSIPLHTFSAMIDYGQYQALTTFGIVGVMVWIYTGLAGRDGEPLQSDMASLVKKNG